MKARISVLTIGVADLENSLAFFTLSGGLKPAIWNQDDVAHDTGLPKTPVSSTSFTIGHNIVCGKMLTR